MKIKETDDYMRLEEVERIYHEINEYVFTEGENITMKVTGNRKWNGYPSKLQTIYFLSLLRRFDLKDDGLNIEKVYSSLETTCERLIKKGIKEVDIIKNDVSILREAGSANFDLKTTIQFISKGKIIDSDQMINSQLYGDFFHSTIENIKFRKVNHIPEDISIFHSLQKYRGYFLQVKNIVSIFKLLKNHIS